MTFCMIYIFIQSECLFELKTEYFALTFLHIPYEEMCITFAHSFHLSSLLVIFTKRLFWQEDTLSLIRLVTYQQERNTCSEKGKYYFTERNMILMKEECFILGREFFVLFVWRNCRVPQL